MPFETPTPATPWIRGASPLEAIVPAASLGQRIAESNQRAAFEYLSMQAQQARFAQQMQMEQSRLEAQQNMEQMKLDASRQIHQENALREDQKLQIENAYHQNVLGLQKQKLELTQTAAANKFAAQQQFISDREQIKNGLIYEEGVDPEEAERRATVQSLFKNGPLMGQSPASLAQLSKAAMPAPDPEVRTTPKGMEYIVTSTGGVKVVPRPQWQERLTGEALLQERDLTQNIRRLDKQLSEETDSDARINLTRQLFQAEELRRNLFKQNVPGPQQSIRMPYTSRGTNAPAQSSPYKDGVKLRKGDDLYEVRNGQPVLIQKGSFSKPQASNESDTSEELPTGDEESDTEGA